MKWYICISILIFSSLVEGSMDSGLASSRRGQSSPIMRTPRYASLFLWFISVFGWGVFNIVVFTVGLTVLFVEQQVDISTTVEGFQERGDDMMTYQFSTSDIITTPHEPSSGSSHQFPQDSPPSPPPPPFPSDSPPSPPPPYHFTKDKTQDQTPDSTPQVKLFLQSITIFSLFSWHLYLCVQVCV